MSFCRAGQSRSRRQSSDSYAAADSTLVVVDGKVVGADPDPNIRFQIERDTGLLAN